MYDSQTNFDTLFLMMGFISLVHEIKFMPISSCHLLVILYYFNIVGEQLSLTSQELQGS